MPWIADSDIQPDVFGSDHCPVWVDLHETIVNENGETIHLKDLVNPPRSGIGDGGNAHRPDPPRFATRYWDEFSGKQRSLKDFFGGGATRKASLDSKAKPPKAKKEVIPAPASSVVNDVGTSDEKGKGTASLQQEGANGTSDPIIDLTNSAENSPVKPKRKTSSSASASIPKSQSTGKKGMKQPPQRKDSSPSQSSLAGFFRPPASVPPSKNSRKTPRSSVTPTRPEPTAPNTSRSPVSTIPDEESDYLFAKALASAEEGTDYDAEDSNDVALDQSQAVASWSSIFAKKVPPRCRVHNLPCKPFGESRRWIAFVTTLIRNNYAVTKIPGKNKGKKFWLCSK